MEYYGGFEYYFPEGMEGAAMGTAGVIAGLFLIVYSLMMGLSVVKYVLGSLGSYRIAKRRGIHHAWLAWVPVGCNWLRGSISDHYQYVVKHKVTKRRRLQLILNLVLAGICLVIGVIACVVMAYDNNALGIALAVFAYFLVLCLKIAVMVVDHICYYDLFRSSKPENAVLFLILGVLFPVIIPFFVFACSKHDKGMPARRAPQSAEQIPCDEAQEVSSAVEPEIPAEEEIPVVEAELVEDPE